MLLKMLRAALRPRASAAPLIKRALDLRDQGRLADAEGVLRAAIKDHPHDAVAATNLAVALLEQDRVDEAVILLQRAIASDPRCAAAHFNFANVLRVSGRMSEAIEHYRAATQADPGFAAAPEELMHAQLETCDWAGAERVAQELREKVERLPAPQWMRYVSPMTATYLGLGTERVRQVAAYHAGLACSGALHEPAPRTQPRARGQRTRIGYFSRDFRDHPVGHLLRSVFALHDRSRFEVHAFSYGPDDGSVYRKAIESSVDGFVDVSHMSDDDAARAISAAGIDVLIDLMGHTTGSRLGVLARRPAPVQTHYLGYAGTTGAAYIDYFLSDATATPTELVPAFTEEVVNVPDCFMVSDGGEALAATSGIRSEQRLPEHAFVFCNFGNASRITQATFESWMAVLRAAPESVLWLKRSHTRVTENLTRAADESRVDPKRLVFAERVPDKTGHFGRVALADLALDTIGWHNGHTTAADMLWAGVPVLTASGKTFASRVASSLVCAASLPELARNDAADYAATAVRLAKMKSESDGLRRKLQAARSSAAFFDTARLMRGLEGAYERMFAAKMPGSSGSVAQSVRAGDS